MRKMLILYTAIFFGTLKVYSQTWTNLINGVGSTASDYVLALAVDSSTNDLYVGGTFNSVSGQAFQNLVKWNGNSYSNVGADGAVTAIAKLNGNLYVGGGYSTISGVAANRAARFNGTLWQPLGAGVNSNIYSFAWYSGLLYAGGDFTGVNGFSTSANHIATWNGATWSPVGAGTTATGCCLSGDVNALCVYNGNLYVGGEFSKAGGVSASCIAMWNGVTWSAVGSGINTYVTSLAVYNNELYAGGNFTTAGGVTAHNIARWNGTAWASVGSPTTLNNPIWAMEVINNELYVAGSFSGVITSGTSRFVAKWNGTSWNNVSTGAGTDNVAFAIAGVQTGWIYTGGAFFSGDGNSDDIHIARLFISTPLPVELISFTAEAGKSFIHLGWTTASETNNSGFELQRSLDAIEFHKISWISGQGNSTAITNYFQDDKNVQPENLYYYRLRQIDFNGEEKLSSIIAAKIGTDESSDLIISQNLLAEEINISGREFNTGDEIMLIDMFGKIIYQKKFSNSALSFKLQTLGFPGGIYFLTISTPSETVTRKLVIQ